MTRAEPVLGLRPGFGLVSLAWLLFAVIHLLPRLGLQISAADGLSMVAAQSLKVAYQISQPPLYDWSVWLVQRITGPTVLGAYLPKYIFAWIAGAFVYLAARDVSRDKWIATIASLSLMLLFNVGVTLHDQTTHSAALLATIAATFYFFVRIAQSGKITDYVGLGVAMALGTLSKYGYLVMPVAVVAAFLAAPPLRSRILSPKFLVSIAIVTVAALPFALWLLAHKAEFASTASTTFIVPSTRSHFARSMAGIVSLMGAYLAYAAFAVPVLWAIWPKLLRRGATRDDLRAGNLQAVLGLSFIVAFAIAVVTILVTGADIMRSRYVHVLAFLLPVYVALYIPTAELTRRRIGAFFGVLAAVQVALATSTAVTPLFPVKPFCVECSALDPIDTLAAALRADGLERATIYAEDHQVVGNLRRYLPDATYRTIKLLSGQSGSAPASPVCVLIEPVTPKTQVAEGARLVTADWPRSWVGPARRSTWKLTRLPVDDPRCR